jgi:hypothetical protein
VFSKFRSQDPSSSSWNLREQTDLISIGPWASPKSSILWDQYLHTFLVSSLPSEVVFLFMHLVDLIVTPLDYVTQHWTKCLWYHQSTWLQTGMVAHACNPSYSRGGDQKDHDERSAWAKTSENCTSTNKVSCGRDPVIPPRHEALGEPWSEAAEQKHETLLQT